MVFAGSFTAGGFKMTLADGKLVIVQEGKNRKFVEQVEQVTFSGAHAPGNGQPVLYITERAVFTLENGEMTLTEIAPGVDLERDILAQMSFQPRISSPYEDDGGRDLPRAVGRTAAVHHGPPKDAAGGVPGRLLKNAPKRQARRGRMCEAEMQTARYCAPAASESCFFQQTC